MMQIASLNLEQTFGKMVKRAYPPHPLKQFFFERQITHDKLGKVLGISKQSVFLYLDRQYPFPDKYEKALIMLADRVRDYERKHGTKFNTYEPIAENITIYDSKPVVQRKAMRK
jgi:hypothetical protein